MAVTSGPRMAHALLARLEAEGKLDEGLRCEILGGELVIRGFPQRRHEDVVNVLMDHFRAWVRTRGGAVYSGLGVEVGDDQLGPDVAFVGPGRVGEVDEDGFHVAPDVVVEVASPRGRGRDLIDKRDVYDEIGVAEYWVVDLARRRVVVHRRDDAGAYEAREHREGTLTTPQAPGLEVPLAELFADR